MRLFEVKPNAQPNLSISNKVVKSVTIVADSPSQAIQAAWVKCNWGNGIAESDLVANELFPQPGSILYYQETD